MYTLLRPHPINYISLFLAHLIPATLFFSIIVVIYLHTSSFISSIRSISFFLPHLCLSRTSILPSLCTSSDTLSLSSSFFFRYTFLVLLFLSISPRPLLLLVLPHDFFETRSSWTRRGTWLEATYRRVYRSIPPSPRFKEPAAPKGIFALVEGYTFWKATMILVAGIFIIHHLSCSMRPI